MAFFDLLERPSIVVPVVVLGISTEALSGIEKLFSTYEVTGISPQSRTLAQLLNGFVSMGTL